LRSSETAVREHFGARRYGAIPLLGVKGNVFIGHGRSDSLTVANAIRTAHDAVAGGTLDSLSAALNAIPNLNQT